MDARWFNSLTKSLSRTGSRRGALRVAGTLPWAGALATVSDEGEASRRSRHGKGDHSRQAGNDARHRAVANRKPKGKGKKKCARSGETPPKGRHCCAGLVEDGAGRCAPPCSTTCSSGCCRGDSCQPGTSDAACGSGGLPCGVCPANTTCQSGSCTCDVCHGGCAFSAIQAAIDAASSGATIRICAGRYEENVTLDKNLTLIGAGGGGDPATSTIIDARNSGRALTVNDGVTSTLQALRLTRGMNPDDSRPRGGGVFSQGRLTMIGCAVTGNTSTTIGGGICQEGPSLTMTDCEVSDNEALSAAGLEAFGSTLTMTNCRITGNAALTDQAGGLKVEPSVRARLTGCVISSNSVEGGGGGIYNGGILTLDSNTVADNVAAQLGGGIFNDGGSVLTLVNSTRVRTNVANPLPGKGGGIFNNGGLVTLTSGSSVSQNNPDNCAGTTC